MAQGQSETLWDRVVAWTIKAGGADITGTADEFRFVWEKLPGNGSVIAHVLTQTNTSPGAKAGVMLRATTDPGLEPMRMTDGLGIFDPLALSRVAPNYDTRFNMPPMAWVMRLRTAPSLKRNRGSTAS